MKIEFREFFYLSNMLSLLRIVMTIPICYLIRLNDPDGLWLLILVSVATGFTDYLDGYFSRRYNQVTELGIVLDPIADKISMAGIMIFLILYKGFPMSLAVLLIYRDILILIFGSMVIRQTGHPIMANMLGKINTSVIAFTGILSMVSIQNLFYSLCLLGSYVILAISAWNYFRLAEDRLFKTPRTVWVFRIGILLLTAIVLWLTFQQEDPERLPFLQLVASEQQIRQPWQVVEDQSLRPAQQIKKSFGIRGFGVFNSVGNFRQVAPAEEPSLLPAALLCPARSA